MIERRSLGLGIFLIVLVTWCFSPRARAMQVTLVADAHVNAARPTVNSGALSNINVGGGYTGLMQFDLSLLPPGTSSAQISRAVLRLYVNQLDTAGTVNLAPVTSAWSEYGVTYATMPSVGGMAQVFTVNQAGVFVAIDVTALVQGWVAAPLSNQGLALTAGTAVLQIDSKENDLTAHAPVLDVQIVSQGPAGPAGAGGATGQQGVPGLNGAMGPAGPQGPTGAQGVVGPQGAMGPQGIAGTVGPTGVAGVAGPQGATGPIGPAGATGAAGQNGAPGLVFRGAYAAGTNYAAKDAVTYAGSSWISLVAGNVGNQPDVSPAQWAQLAKAGDPGATGSAGQAGAAGLPGAMGAPGAAGATGSQGPAGAPGMVFRGAWVAGNGYTANDAVTYAGATWLALAASTSVVPGSAPGSWAVLAAAGAVGPSGPSGAAATVTVGTVTTGAAGSAATVVNSGTSSAAVLNFTLPQGAAGVPGAGGGGGGGISGIPYATMYHAVSYSAKFYSVNNTNQSVTETAAVLSWIPDGCSATKLVVYSQQGATITVTLRSGTPGSMTNTALTCQAATNQSCTSTAAVAIPAGSFIDLEIDNPDSSPVGVWSAVTCN